MILTIFFIAMFAVDKIPTLIVAKPSQTTELKNTKFKLFPDFSLPLLSDDMPTRFRPAFSAA